MELGFNSEQTLDFFAERLEAQVLPSDTMRGEMMYVASVLAHYAQTSVQDPTWMVPSGSLYEILDKFVLIPGLEEDEVHGITDPLILEVAGSHILLLAGFFRDQMKKKHDLRLYDALGASFFHKASMATRQENKSELMRRVGRHFPLWVRSCQQVAQVLREDRYILRFD